MIIRIIPICHLYNNKQTSKQNMSAYSFRLYKPSNYSLPVGKSLKYATVKVNGYKKEFIFCLNISVTLKYIKHSCVTNNSRNG